MGSYKDENLVGAETISILCERIISANLDGFGRLDTGSGNVKGTVSLASRHSHKKGEGHDKRDSACSCGDRRPCRVCDKAAATACNANLCGRITDSGNHPVSAPTAPAATAAGYMPGRIDGPGWCDLPNPAAASTAAATTARWRTRLSVLLAA